MKEIKYNPIQHRLFRFGYPSRIVKEYSKTSKWYMEESRQNAIERKRRVK